ncbi:MAG TPA: hypothetical protein VKH81_23230 [Candidatus Angelobacter sp.]|nr:hypothetical protein [Candidatus Angelobacter sp.]
MRREKKFTRLTKHHLPNSVISQLLGAAACAPQKHKALSRRLLSFHQLGSGAEQELPHEKQGNGVIAQDADISGPPRAPSWKKILISSISIPVRSSSSGLPVSLCIPISSFHSVSATKRCRSTGNKTGCGHFRNAPPCKRSNFLYFDPSWNQLEHHLPNSVISQLLAAAACAPQKHKALSRRLLSFHQLVGSGAEQELPHEKQGKGTIWQEADISGPPRAPSWKKILISSISIPVRSSSSGLPVSLCIPTSSFHSVSATKRCRSTGNKSGCGHFRNAPQCKKSNFLDFDPSWSQLE